MSKTNPQVEQMSWELTILRKELAERKKDPGFMPVEGCSDGSCIVKAPTGMHTNGGCRCEERTLRRALMWQKRFTVFLEETINTLRDDNTKLKNELLDAQMETWKLQQQQSQVATPPVISVAETSVNESPSSPETTLPPKKKKKKSTS